LTVFVYHDKLFDVIVYDLPDWRRKRLEYHPGRTRVSHHC
jgi:hypothetical protein